MVVIHHADLYIMDALMTIVDVLTKMSLFVLKSNNNEGFLLLFSSVERGDIYKGILIWSGPRPLNPQLIYSLPQYTLLLQLLTL